MAHAGLSHALFTSNPYLLGLSTSDRAGCAVRCAAELFLNALESNATEVRVEVRAAGGGVVEVEASLAWRWPRARETRRGAFSAPKEAERRRERCTCKAFAKSESSTHGSRMLHAGVSV